MASLWLDFEGSHPECGNCNHDLGLPFIRAAFLYDEASEVPPEIKDGRVNLATCPVCRHQGSIWTGFLAIDRTRCRAVFCIYSDDAAAERQLEALWARAAAHLNEALTERLRKRVVWVHSYADIFETLCQLDEHFAFNADYYVRLHARWLGSSDAQTRARAWLADALATRGLFLAHRERTPPFLALVREVIGEFLASGKTHPLTEPLRTWHEEILRYALPARAQTSSEDDDTAAPANARLIPGSLSPELERALDRLITAGTNAPTPTGDSDSDIRDCIDSWKALQKDSAPDAADVALTEALVQLREHAPSGESVRREDGDESLESLLDRTLQLNEPELDWIARRAFDHLPDRPRFALALVRFLVSSGRAMREPYFRFLVNALAYEFLTLRGASSIALAALAATCLSPFRTRGKPIWSAPDFLQRLGVCWQRLGNGFVLRGDEANAAASLGVAAKFFGLVSHLHGELQSLVRLEGTRLEAYDLSPLAASDRLLERVTQARAQIEATDGREAYMNLLAEAVQLVLLRQFAAWGGDPRITQRRVDTHVGAAGNTDAAAPIICIYCDAIKAPSAQDAPAASDGDVILLSFDNRAVGPYVADVSIRSIAWFESARRLLQLSAEGQQRTAWYGAYAQLIEGSQSFGLGAVFYFVRLMQIESFAHGFSEIPFDSLVRINLCVARAYYGYWSEHTEMPPPNPSVERILDSLADSATDALFVKGATPLQGLTNPHGPSNRHLSPATLLAVADVLEGGSRYAAAATKYRLLVRHCEALMSVRTTERDHERLRYMRTTALYRWARACLKEHQVTGSPALLTTAVHAIEAYKVAPLQRATADAAARSDSASTVTAYDMAELQELVTLFPAGCFIMQFALLQESESSGGFWFAALIDPRDGRVLFPRCIPFEAVHEAASAAIRDFAAARRRLDGRTPADVETDEPIPRLNQTLETLGDALFTPEVLNFLIDERARHLIICPESYLYDIPFAALRVTMGGSARFLIDLNGPQGLALTLAPHLTHFRRRKTPVRRPGARPSSEGTAAVLSFSPRWRPDLAPLYGVSRSLNELTAASEGRQTFTRGPGTVSGFLRSLAEHRTVLFFGHGEVDERHGALLIAEDGVVGKHEVDSFSAGTHLNAALLLLCACSGVGANVLPTRLNKDLAGIHLSLLAGGVGCVLGSLVPTYPICALFALEQFFSAENSGVPCHERLLRVYRAFLGHPQLNSPVFWGHLVLVGDPYFDPT